jgi:hypothetical protein
VSVRADPPAHRIGSHFAQLGGLVADPDHLEPLRHAYVADISVADSLAQRGGLGREPFPGVDIAVEQGKRGLPGPQQVVVAGWRNRSEKYAYSAKVARKAGEPFSSCAVADSSSA